MNILILENDVQNLVSSTCGEFQLCFYKDLFDPDEKSKIISHDNLNKKTLETIINEIFYKDIDEMNTQFRILKKNKICKFLYLGIKNKNE